MDVRHLLSQDFLDYPDRLGDWVKVIGLTFSGLTLALCSNLYLPWSSPNYKALRLIGTALGTGLIAYSSIKTRELEKTERYHQIRIDAALDIYSAVTARQALPLIEGEIMESSPQLPIAASNFDVGTFLNEATGIAILGNSGSAKTCLAQFIAAQVKSQILVLDPHADPNNPEYPWSGLPVVIADKDKILDQLETLLTLLDKHDQTPLTIIADEWPSIRLHAKRNGSRIADDFLIRYGSEARKFNKLPILLSQSGNTKALGLEGLGDYLENFALVRLGKCATKYAKNLSDQTILGYCKNTAYPMLLGDVPVCHPTHGHYKQRAKHQKPANLTPLQSLPITIPLVTNLVTDPDTKQTHTNTQPQPHQKFRKYHRGHQTQPQTR